MKNYQVLIVDDHPIIAEAYKSALIQYASTNKKVAFNITILNTIDAALSHIENAKTGTTIDFVFLDIKLPAATDGKTVSGEDLGIKIRESLPETKIIVATTYNENYRVNNILKSIDPDAFLVKNDITPADLLIAIENVLNNDPYYSKTVLKLFRNYMSNDIFLDKIDRQLLYELSIGTKTVELPNLLPLSRSGIERRKRQLKELFNISKKESDKALIEAAKQKGFI